MSDERIRIDLERDDDEWNARVVELDPDDPASELVVGRRFSGGGPADALEQLGQELDKREVERIRRRFDI